MGFVHRDKDSRSCGATTIGTGTNVRVNGRTVAVQGDKNSHGGGALTSTVPTVRVGSKPIIVQNNPAARDNHKDSFGNFDHPNPRARGASANVRAGG